MKAVRWLFGLAGFGLLLCALASWWIGLQIETQVRQGHAQLSEQLGVPVQLQSYRRGWFSSEASSQIHLGDGNGGLVLKVQHHIAHGPLPGWRSVGLVSATSDGVISPDARPMPDTPNANGVFLQIQSQLGFDRRVLLTISGQPGSFTDANGGYWSVGALQGQLNLAPQWRSFSAELEWDGMQWTGAQDALIAIGAVALTGQYQLPAGRDALYDGRSEAQLAHLELRHVFAPGVPTSQQVPYALRIDGLALSNRLDTQTAIGQASASLKADATRFDDMQTGAVQWLMSLDAIPVETLAHLMPRLGDWLNQQQQTPSASAQTLTLAEQQAIQTDIAALFQQGLRLQLDRASVELPAGEVVLTGFVQAPSLTGTDLSFLPMSLAAKLDLRFHVRLPAVLAQNLQGASIFNALLTQGLWQRDGPLVEAALVYQRGLNTINGIPAEPASLVQWFGQ
ncbi:DUF945 domain-containing protein [Lampropedia aestuarii]|uniref:DUF945 domain-containing protein n=1 Tax=Lampropedia aestuarii TaxID=2562762 RepID=A0A4S5BQE0_9BURK|nr:DUF945 family protein [Lampropedia aestuarii]THJ34974.1 DUF945 domain-containing protein [Lampropedia aestuarii]